VKSQQQFIDECLEKYKCVSLPISEHWEDAHYPIPNCLGGTETIRLWSRDHAAHGVIQSEEFDHPCLHSYRWHLDRSLIELYYPELLTLLDKWQSSLVKTCGLSGLETQRELNLGFFNPDFHADLEIKSKAGKIGGKVTAEKDGAQTLIDWVKDPHNEKKRKEICSLGGKASKGSTGLRKITNGTKNKMIPADVEVPIGWRYGCTHKRRVGHEGH
jgi:hypothetical protein